MFNCFTRIQVIACLDEANHGDSDVQVSSVADLCALRQWDTLVV